MASATVEGGHGRETGGKCSPDGVFKEWAWARDVAAIVVETLNAHGVTCTDIVPGDEDMPLKERCKAVNAIARVRTDNVHVSIHCNASGTGKAWYDARGWQVHTCLNPSVNSRRLANLMYDEAVAKGFKVRPESPGMHFRPKNLAILRDTTCPAVLVENFFQDNKEDVKYLLGPTSIYECADVICRAVLRYFNKGGF